MQLKNGIARRKEEKEEWRHCERSEAISIRQGDCFVVLCTPRNDVERSLFLFCSVRCITLCALCPLCEAQNSNRVSTQNSINFPPKNQHDQMKLLFYTIIISLLASCSNKRTMEYFVISDGSTHLDTLPILDIRVDSFSERAQTIAYYTAKDTIAFALRTDSSVLSEMSGNTEDNKSASNTRNNEIIASSKESQKKNPGSELHLIKTDSVRFQDGLLKLYRYVQHTMSGDDYFYYWSPGIGIICRHSTNSFAILQSRDSLPNLKINRLLKMVDPVDNEDLRHFIGFSK